MSATAIHRLQTAVSSLVAGRGAPHPLAAFGTTALATGDEALCAATLPHVEAAMTALERATFSLTEAYLGRLATCSVELASVIDITGAAIDAKGGGDHRASPRRVPMPYDLPSRRAARVLFGPECLPGDIRNLLLPVMKASPGETLASPSENDRLAVILGSSKASAAEVWGPVPTPKARS